ncbi:MAG: leucine-rich repeat domain-containing protein [Oscillospiraceae bacterium]|nr:leucine-rich repeat domain-containing protein [Oscillospiraceae bacterium]
MGAEFFESCTSLSNIKFFGESLSARERCFSKRSGLVEVNLPRLKEIPNCCFKDYLNLSRLKVPYFVQKVGR